MIEKIAAALVKPIVDLVRTREERKLHKDAAKAKLVQAKQEGATEVTLKDQELEVVLATQMERSWKDEFVTLLILSPFVTILFGGIAAAFGEVRVLEGTSLAIQTLTAADVNVGFLMEAVTLSAIGLSVWRSR